MLLTQSPVSAVFNYIRWQDKFRHEKPYEIESTKSTAPGSIPLTNIEGWDPEEQLVTDVRRDELSYNLDDHGFTYLNLQNSFSAFYDRKRVQEEYIPHVVEPFLLKNADNATRVFVFNWRVWNAWSAFPVYTHMVSATKERP